jgi:hypothetical protein
MQPGTKYAQVELRAIYVWSFHAILMKIFSLCFTSKTNTMDESDINLFDHIHTFGQDMFARLFMRYMPNDASHQAGVAEVFILKFILDGLQNKERDSQTDQFS